MKIYKGKYVSLESANIFNNEDGEICGEILVNVSTNGTHRTYTQSFTSGYLGDIEDFDKGGVHVNYASKLHAMKKSLIEDMINCLVDVYEFDRKEVESEFRRAF